MNAIVPVEPVAAEEDRRTLKEYLSLRAALLNLDWLPQFGVTVFGAVCDCECHQHGVIMMHCVPCCDACEFKFK